ncbi:MAG: hypothetical protein Q9196_001408 [Gyalolechia fulgens]
MVDAIHIIHNHDIDKSDLDLDNLGPTLSNPSVGHPIAHTQVIALSKALKEIHGSVDEAEISYHLEDLLRGAKVYAEPSKSKAEPVSLRPSLKTLSNQSQTTEYKALMARLRREEENRAYERMINPPLPMESFEQRFPNSSNARLFSGDQAQVDEDDEVTYADINRQMALIVNILVSIVACSIALWLVANRWSAPSRLAFSMGGSILVAVAETVIYAGYLRRVKEARAKGKNQVEIKEIIKTWVIGNEDAHQYRPREVNSKGPKYEQARRRNVKNE